MDILYDHRNLRLLTELWSGPWDGAAWYDLRLARAGFRQVRDFQRLLVLDACPGLSLYPHQREALVRVMGEMGGLAILADEVGLGKTIEAGAIIKEYILRGMAQRVLILVPPSLLPQWEEELREKFGLDPGVNPAAWADHDLTLVSLELAKRQPHAGNLLRCSYDLVVVDEAHRLRNRQTAGWSLVNRLRRRYLLLLTATPIQNNLRELYNLVTLLKPGQLRTFSSFRREFMLDEQSARNPQKLRELIRQVMVRTRRSEMTVFFPPRQVHDLTCALHPAEERLYRGILEAVRGIYRRETENVGAGDKDKKRSASALLLTLILLLREACSSAPATAETLSCLRRRPGLPPEVKQNLTRLIQRAKGLQRLSKLERLFSLWPDLPQPVLVFTEFRRTQELILAKMAERGIPAAAYHGGLSPAEKQAALAAFRSGAALVSTDTGGEGLNLQFSRCLVNFDLPWNPMRLEQRIGRIHRLGQDRGVCIYNLATAGTVEERVLDLIRRKIRLFETVIGELDLILEGLNAQGLEKRIGETVLSAADDAQMEAGFQTLGSDLAGARARYDQVCEWNNRVYEGEWGVQPVDAGGDDTGSAGGAFPRTGFLAGTP